MTQIKVTPERLEQSAKLVLETKNRLEQIHKDLYNQTEYVASMWNGATSQRFYQMFNETKPQMFNVFREFDKIAEELMHAAEKFRNADERYDGNLVDGNLSDEKVEEGAMCGKPSEKSMLRKIWDGIYVGSGQVIGGIVEGFDSLDDTVTKENIKYAIGHPIETTFTAWNAVSDSFMNDFWHGDAESRTKWGTSVFMGLGLGWLGDKGISKVGKVTTLAKGTNLTKFSEGISSVSNQLPLKDRFAFAGTSGFGSNQIKAFEALQEARDTFMFSETGGKSRVKGVQEVIKDYADKVFDRVDVKNDYPDSYTASQKLREELKDAGIETPPYPNAAHHIVPWNDKRAVEAQELLKEIEIHHDSASNGVFLPYKKNDYVTTEVLHIGSHSKEYIREVTERVNSVIEMGGTQVDVAEVLHKIRQDLLEGKIRLNEPKE
ncbi:WXG100 family type VII secretion target [Bacillus mycoides]|uniref:WXG100 family type VII secretion target n=1 Tax=Bacillus mycoides TaxID=1405 RepID=UPI0010BF4369|nr:WXG100 family type VII secretion target [Bacillus mycoides]QWH02533.1 WXG100 family type VII secretion target [Bacillus mycoides]TKI32039.1 WXG100 family type VII secretion target [Bacillus mycoides]